MSEGSTHQDRVVWLADLAALWEGGREQRYVRHTSIYPCSTNSRTALLSAYSCASKHFSLRHSCVTAQTAVKVKRGSRVPTTNLSSFVNVKRRTESMRSRGSSESPILE